jgi:hypothetical protein
VQIASLQSMRSESREYPDAQIVIIDEAHCAVSDTCLDLCRHYKVLLTQQFPAICFQAATIFIPRAGEGSIRDRFNSHANEA